MTRVIRADIWIEEGRKDITYLSQAGFHDLENGVDITENPRDTDGKLRARFGEALTKLLEEADGGARSADGGARDNVVPITGRSSDSDQRSEGLDGEGGMETGPEVPAQRDE